MSTANDHAKPRTTHYAPRTNSRTGAALIIAVVILAAMLMLGLPFLFTQSGSLSGTRSFAHERLASVGQDSAQNMGIAAAAKAMIHHHTSSGGRVNDWTSLWEDLRVEKPINGVRSLSYGINRIELDTRTEFYPRQNPDPLRNPYTFIGPGPAIVGVSIEDESGKLDPNYLDAEAWHQLLEAVHISDSDSDNQPNSINFQLASALTRLRFELPSGRITHLDQLLQALPPTGTANYRPGLTQAELALLKPHLTLYALGLGRGGQIDLGTNIISGDLALDSVAPGELIAFPPVASLLGSGSTLVATDAAGNQSTFSSVGWSNAVPNQNTAITVASPPAVNLHQTSAQVREVFLQIGKATRYQPPMSSSQLLEIGPPSPALLTELKSVTTTGRDRDGINTNTDFLNGFDLLTPMNRQLKIATCRVQPSNITDRAFGAGGDFSSIIIGNPTVIHEIPPAPGLPILDKHVTRIRIFGSGVEQFPANGFAILEGIDAESNSDDPRKISEVISYRSLNLPTDNRNAIIELEPVGREKLAKHFLADGLTITAIGPRDIPPLSISSTGVFTIDSASTVIDPAGNQSAHEQHRVVAQALPQEEVLEKRYTKQSELHALIAQRHGSLLTSFPQPYPRITTDILPDDPKNGAAPSTMTDPELRTGLRPAVLKSLVTANHIDHDWSVSFSGTKDTATTSTSGAPNPPPSGDPYDVNDITPEGLRLDSNRILSYPNGNNGLIKSNVAGADLTSIEGRQFSLWVRPDEDWTGKTIALLDLQAPQVNAGEALGGSSVSTKATDPRVPTPRDASNRFSLRYEGVTQQLILELNPGAIPHLNNYGPKIPRAFYTFDSSLNDVRSNYFPAINTESLGSGGISPMACAAKQSTIQHRYYVGSTFVAGHWHLIQAAFSSNQPGGMSIIVDNLVGRDVSRVFTSDPSAPMTVPGDHLTVPSLLLKDDLITDKQVKDIGSKALYQSSIALDAWAPASGGSGFKTGASAVTELLPERGIVRIGNEYISYQSIDANGALRDCVRARRQWTTARNDQQPDGSKTVNWNGAHVMENHYVGDPVYPGGFALKNVNGTLYRGGWSLAESMPDGSSTHYYQVWSRASQIIPANSSAIILNRGVGVTSQFPPRGFIRVVNGNSTFQLYYDNGVNAQNKGILPKNTPTVNSPTPTLSNIYHWDSTSGFTRNTKYEIPLNAEIELISQEIKNDFDPLKDPTKNDAYPTSGMLQLYDARNGSQVNRGRAEWISYTEIRSGRTVFPPDVSEASDVSPFPPTSGLPAVTRRLSFVINLSPDTDSSHPGDHGGFWFNKDYRTGSRGRERTAFAHTDFTDYRAAYEFPAGTRVIPVQTVDEFSYLLEAGDVVTLAPTNLAAGQKPIQMCVRFSADDAFPETKTMNNTAPPYSLATKRHFAFTEAIPDSWNPGNTSFHLLCWPCWTPEENISPTKPINPDTWKNNTMGWMLPWANSFYPNYDTTLTREPLVIGATSGTTAGGMKATIDSIQAGAQPGSNQLIQSRIKSVYYDSDNNDTLETVVINSAHLWLKATNLTTPTLITANDNIFSRTHGVVEIGGETFIYDSTNDKLQAKYYADNDYIAERKAEFDSIPNNQAELIGRAQLGSVARQHQGQESILILPIGPVSVVETALGIKYQGAVTLSPSFSAPAMLLTSRNGDYQEITVMPNSYSAPWLRGLYNTTANAWEANSGTTFKNLAPIAIGWWPRYAPGLPKDTMDRSAQQRGALLRCRSFAWANFPMRFHQTYFRNPDDEVKLRERYEKELREKKGDNIRKPNDNPRLAPADYSTVTVFDDGVIDDDRSLFDLSAFAMPGRMVWEEDVSFAHPRRVVWEDYNFDTDKPVPLKMIDDNPVGEAFLKSLFRMKLPESAHFSEDRPTYVDGADLRVIWTYREDPLPAKNTPTSPAAEWLQNAALSGNRAPMLGPVTIRGRAPSVILNVER